MLSGTGSGTALLGAGQSFFVPAHSIHLIFTNRLLENEATSSLISDF
jgi:hypothetical protein